MYKWSWAMPFRIVIVVLFFLSGGATAKTLMLAAEDDYYPFSATVNGKLVGLVPDLSRAAFAAVGVDVQFITSPYPRVLLMVESGQMAGGFTGAIDDSNESTFYWHTTPLSTVRLAIWARSGTEESHLTALNMEGHNVSITRGFFYTDAIDMNDKVNKTIAPSDESSLKMLALGRSDYALVTEKIGHSVIQSSDHPELKDRIKVVGLIDEVPLFAFFSKAHPEGKQAAVLFQRGLETIIENGLYGEIIERWRPQGP